MILTVPLTELRPQLPRIMDGIAKSFDRCVVTRHGKPEAVIMAGEDYASLMETLDVLSDTKLMKELKSAQADLNQGRGVSWGGLKKKLGYV